MAVRPEEQSPPAGDLAVQIVPMRRRHLRSVLAIEAQVYPRPWSLGLFLGELNLHADRAYFVARAGGRVIGYGGLNTIAHPIFFALGAYTAALLSIETATVGM